MNQFLEQFVYYLCSRCVILVPHHQPQPKGTDGRHSHNGEILDLLEPHLPSSDRILSAYRTWQDCDPPADIQAQMAAAYNRGARTTPVNNQERAVKILLDNIADTWIRHGLEHPHPYNRRAAFPDPDSRYWIGNQVRQHREQGWYAVDLDTVPFCAFREHPVEQTSGLPWTYTVGLLPYARFRAYSGKLTHPQDRDHLYARSSIPAREWLFLYRDLDQHTLDLETQTQLRTQMLESGVPALHNTTADLLIQLYRHLRQYSMIHPSRVAEPR